jgi:hypothetical protein
MTAVLNTVSRFSSTDKKCNLSTPLAVDSIPVTVPNLIVGVLNSETRVGYYELFLWQDHWIVTVSWGSYKGSSRTRGLKVRCAAIFS